MLRYDTCVARRTLSSPTYTDRNYGTFAPTYFRSRERKYHRWNFRSSIVALHFPYWNDVLWSLLTICAISGNNNIWTRGAKVPCHFPSQDQKFHVILALGSESSREPKFHGTKVRPMELSLPGAKNVGTKVPVTTDRLGISPLLSV